MQRTSFADMPCPIARSLERVGEWWSMLILRDAFAGKTRFDDFQQSLGIAPNMLTRRLASLVEAGMLERRRYSQRPPRDEYLLTARGREFRSVLLALLTFGQRHFPAEAGGARLVDSRTGETVQPMLVDSRTGEALSEPHYRVVRGLRAEGAGNTPADALAGSAGLLSSIEPVAPAAGRPRTSRRPPAAPPASPPTESPS